MFSLFLSFFQGVFWSGFLVGWLAPMVRVTDKTKWETDHFSNDFEYLHFWSTLVHAPPGESVSKGPFSDNVFKVVLSIGMSKLPGEAEVHSYTLMVRYNPEPARLTCRKENLIREEASKDVPSLWNQIKGVVFAIWAHNTLFLVHEAPRFQGEGFVPRKI